MTKNSDKSSDSTTNDDNKSTTKGQDEVLGNLRGAGLDQKEKSNLSQEGGGGSDPNKAGVLPGQEVSEENTSPLADSIEAEKLAQYKKNAEEGQDNG